MPPFMQFLMSVFATQKQEEAEGAARDANKGREREIRNEYNRMIPQLMGQFNVAAGNNDFYLRQLQAQSQNKLRDLEGRTGQDFANRESQFQRRLGQASGDTLGTLRDRFGQVTGLLDGLGEQQLADIDERSEQRRGALRGDLASRGLGTSSLLGDVDRTVERERGRERRLVQDDLNRLQAEVRSNLLGDIAGAQERFGTHGATFGAALAGDTANARNQMGQFSFLQNLGLGQNRINQALQNQFRGIDLRNSLMQNKLGFIERINDVAPSDNAFNQFLLSAGQQAAGPPDTPSTMSQAAPGLIAGGGTVLTAKIVFLVCVDAEAMILMHDDSTKPLREVQIGDKVRNSSGHVRRVVAKDYGEPDPSRATDFVRMTSKINGATLVLTKDHLMGGFLPADIASSDPLMRIDVAEPVPCGDIRLEDGSDYVANDFVVSSMITTEHMAEYPSIAGVA